MGMMVLLLSLQTSSYMRGWVAAELPLSTEPATVYANRCPEDQLFCSEGHYKHSPNTERIFI